MNKIQVYGLPRSGTNFVEWSLVNNFENLEYKNVYNFCEIQEYPKKALLPYSNKIVEKHNYPKLEICNFAIVIFKKWDLFSDSYYRWAGSRLPKQIYDRFLDKANDLDKSKIIIFEHTWLVENYAEGLRMISDKFSIKLKDKIAQPKNELDKSGADCKEKKNAFILKKT